MRGDVQSVSVTEEGEPVAAFAMPADGFGKFVPRATRWRCDRLNRVFTATADTGETATFSVRTPSCANRLTVRAPRRVKPRRRFVAQVRDTWGAGLASARVCFRDHCDQVHLADGVATATARFPSGRRGRARVVLYTPQQRELAAVAVGVKAHRAARSGPTVLVTGDSLMQSVDAILGDAVGDSLSLVSDVRLGSALSSESVVDWRSYAHEQVRRDRPHATVIFLGANDSYPMEGAECCGDAWEDQYARRAKDVMETFAQDGAGAVAWIAIPAAEDERRNPAAAAVNRALLRAAATVPGATVVRADELLTPGGVYRSHMRIKGRRVRVRQSDGIHLTAAGAGLVADAIEDVLEKARLL